MDELEKAVAMVLEAGLSTGHAETFSQLMGEVLWQLEEIRERAQNIDG